MSSRKRPLGEYLRAAARLAETNRAFQKYVGRTDLTSHEKSAIAKVFGFKPYQQRSDTDYLRSAKELSKFAPSLKKYRKMKTLTRWQKAAISYKERVLRYSDYLIPLTPKQAKKMKGFLYAPGINAIRLGNVGHDARIKKITSDIVVVSNGRTFLYWKLPIRGPRIKDKTDAQDEAINRKSQKHLKKAAKAALDDLRGSFPIEQIAELAKRAFARIKTLQVFLWAEAGRVGEGFHNFDEFMQWLYESYSQYRNVERWVNGIAIELKA